MVYKYFITSQVLNLYFILQILGIFGIHEFVITGTYNRYYTINSTQVLEYTYYY